MNKPQTQIEAPPQEATETTEAPERIADAIAQARERIEKGEPLVPEEESEDDAVQEREAETVDVGQRAGDGGEVGEGGEEAGGQAPGPEEGAPEEEEGEGGEEDVEGEVFTVKLPSRREGEPAIELDLADLDEESKEGFRRLMNNGLRRDQLDMAMEELRGVQAEVNNVLIAMSADPINFIMERTTPELRRDLARHLLADAATYESVVPEIARWDRSQEAREAAMATLERDRILAQRNAEGYLARQQQSRENARQIRDHVASMVPEDASEDLRDLFMDQAMDIIRRYAEQQDVWEIPVEQIEPILRQSRVLRLLEAQGAVRPTPHPTGPSSAGPARPAAPVTSLREAEETAQRFRTTSANKRKAAAVAPPGAGPAPMQPPQAPEDVDRSVRKKIAWYRKTMLKR